MSHEAQTREDRKEKIWVFLFFEIYKMVLIMIKSENCSYTGDFP